MNKENDLKNSKSLVAGGLFIGRTLSMLPPEAVGTISHYFFLDDKESINFKIQHQINAKYFLNAESLSAKEYIFNSIAIMGLTYIELAKIERNLPVDMIAQNGKLILYVNINSDIQKILILFVQPGYTFKSLTYILNDVRDLYEIIIEKDSFQNQHIMSKYFYHIHEQISALNGKT